MNQNRVNPAASQRRDQIFRESIHDPYLARSKPKEPTVCSVCGLVFMKGRWQSVDEIPSGAASAVCPACQRIRDKVPAGLLTLSGRFFDGHRDEIMHLVDNTVASQRTEHPLKRIMATEDSDEGTVISFTDTHLPHAVGAAVENAYKGELKVQFNEGAGIVHAHWRRDD
jgi:NMD protein affecting ribosome stability and mRNA decay